MRRQMRDIDVAISLIITELRRVGLYWQAMVLWHTYKDRVRLLAELRLYLITLGYTLDELAAFDR